MVVKVMVLLSLAGQVASDSSKSEEVKLQEHISWIVLEMPVISICWASFWKMLCFSKTRRQSTNTIE